MKRTGMTRTDALRWKPKSRNVVTHVLTAKRIAGFLWPAAYMSEADWDGTLQDWSMKLGSWSQTFHVYNSSRSAPGWFDRVWLKPGTALFVELKVRYRNGTANRLSKEQMAFQSAGALAGLDVRHWLFPDDCVEAWETLTGRPWAECPYVAEKKE